MAAVYQRLTMTVVLESSVLTWNDTHVNLKHPALNLKSVHDTEGSNDGNITGKSLIIFFKSENSTFIFYDDWLFKYRWLEPMLVKGSIYDPVCF